MTEPGVELKSRPPEWRCSDWITWTLGDYYGCFTYFKISEEKVHAYPLRQVVTEYKSRVMSNLTQGNVKSNTGNTGESQTPEQEKLSRYQEWLREISQMFLKMGHRTGWFFPCASLGDCGLIQITFYDNHLLTLQKLWHSGINLLWSWR